MEHKKLINVFHLSWAKNIISIINNLSLIANTGLLQVSAITISYRLTCTNVFICTLQNHTNFSEAYCAAVLVVGNVKRSDMNTEYVRHWMDILAEFAKQQLLLPKKPTKIKLMWRLWSQDTVRPISVLTFWISDNNTGKVCTVQCKRSKYTIWLRRVISSPITLLKKLACSGLRSLSDSRNA